MSDDKFQGRYQVDDGYAGGSRPQHFTVNEWELEDDMTDADLERLYEELAEDHFRENISFSLSRSADFVEWAKKKLADRATAAKE